jgi:hypothetical protein
LCLFFVQKQVKNSVKAIRQRRCIFSRVVFLSKFIKIEPTQMVIKIFLLHVRNVRQIFIFVE